MRSTSCAGLRGFWLPAAHHVRQQSQGHRSSQSSPEDVSSQPDRQSPLPHHCLDLLIGNPPLGAHDHGNRRAIWQLVNTFTDCIPSKVGILVQNQDQAPLIGRPSAPGG